MPSFRSTGSRSAIYPLLRALEIAAEIADDTEQPGTFYIVRSKTIVKGGISNKAELRIQAHARQGLDTVVARIDSTDGLIPPMLEREWMVLVQRFPDQHLMKTDLEDGYTEALWRNSDIDRRVRDFIERHADSGDRNFAA